MNKILSNYSDALIPFLGISFLIFIFIVIFLLGFLFYKGLATSFNKIEEKITGVKKQDPINQNLPLKELSKIQGLSLRDTFYVYIGGFLPFIGWLLLPKKMEKLNITDYYELRFESKLEKLKQSNINIEKASIYKFKSFKEYRAFTAKNLCLSSILLYFEIITHFMEYLKFLGFPLCLVHEQSLSEISVFLHSQSTKPFFESIFFQNLWILLLAAIFYYSWKYWSAKIVTSRLKS